jgi:hypothetical protein
MREVLSGCSKAIAAILAILFVITALVALILFNVERELFNPELYKDAMAELEFYDELPGLLAEQLQFGMTYNPCEEDPSQCEGEGPPDDGDGEGGPPEFFQNLTTEDWERLLTGLVPGAWLRTQAEGIIDQLFAMLESGEVGTEIMVSMVGLKAHMLGDDGMDAILGLIRAQPPCTSEQMMQLGQLEIDMSTVSMLLMCSPPPEFIDELLPQMRPILEEVVGGINDEVNLMDSLGGMGGGEGEPQPTPADGDGDFSFETFRWVRLANRLSPLLPLVLLLLVTLFGVRSLKGFFLWWGIPLLIVGVIAFTSSSAVPLLMNWAISRYGSSLLPEAISTGLLDLAIDLVHYVLGSITSAINTQGAILGGVGLVFIIVSFFFKRRRQVVVEPRLEEFPQQDYDQ